jgi:universal stress protein A
MFAPKNILVPTDFSDYSDYALRQAKELARQYKSKINLLHVVEPVAPFVLDYVPKSSEAQVLEDVIVAQSKVQLQDEINKLSDLKDIEIQGYVREGHPADEILLYQVEKGIDLIVMSSHGKTRFVKRLIGNVSEKVAEEAKCSVLIVRS